MREYVIIGQGLAGSVLAYRLIEAGCRVRVIDPDLLHTSSKVAAGMIDPLAGQRYLLAWQADRFLPEAVSFYQSLEKKFQTRFFFPIPMIRFFSSPQDVRLWQQKRHQTQICPYFGACVPPFWNRFTVPDGGVEVLATGYLDTRRFLAAMKAYLIEKKSYVQDHINPHSFDLSRAGLTIFCEGHAAKDNPFFRHLPFQNVKGDILTIRCDSLIDAHILHKGKFMLPIGEGMFRVAPTYIRGFIDDRPTAEGRQELKAFLYQFMPWLFYEVKAHQAGIRPALQTNRPVLGLHPHYPHIGIFNGLGSRGVMMAPCFSRVWTDFLLAGIPIPKEVDVAQFSVVG